MSNHATDVQRLYLHVGHAKTGTSYLQSVFWGSREALAGSGLVLPLRGSGDHFHLAMSLRDELDEATDGASAFTVEERLVEQLREVDAPRVLISHEVLSSVPAAEAARFRDLVDGYEVHIVLTVRDLRRQIPAEWQQRVKTRGTLTYEEFLDGVVDRSRRGRNFWLVQDTVDVAERWRGDLPPERVHVVTTPPPGSAPTLLLERYCRVLGVDPALLDTELSRSNESLGAQQVELLRRVNVALGGRLPRPRTGYNRVAKNDFANEVLADQHGDRLDLPERLDEWCRREAERIIDHVHSAGYEVAGDLGDLLPPPRSGAATSHAVTDEQVAAAAVDGIAALLAQRHQDINRLQQLKQQLRTAEQRNQQLRRTRNDLDGTGRRQTLRARLGLRTRLRRGRRAVRRRLQRVARDS